VIFVCADVCAPGRRRRRRHRRRLSHNPALLTRTPLFGKQTQTNQTKKDLLPKIRSPVRSERRSAQRAAINTPIQGSAADVAAAAMLSIARDAALRDAGWRLLLQVHDEVMLEGPRESAEAAKARVVACMENPWHNLIGLEGKPLLVDLAVDCKSADTWYEAK
jgi:DNA polymerase I-like protein with 3'-5' exonuclease and polymerase domains